MSELTPQHIRTTLFSADRVYRFTLWRDWEQEYGFFNTPAHPNSYVNFIGLNPSTADETLDDPTIRRCIRFAKDWGYPAYCMTNIFAYRETKAALMRKHPAPIGEGNDGHLLNIAKAAGLVVAAWGANGGDDTRGRHVAALLAAAGVKLHALAVNDDGSPQHPLYLPLKSIPTPWPQ